ncbi:MAG: hypothetical protein Q9191_006067, partial [Dirinaria sp. TL-2023a]
MDEEAHPVRQNAGRSASVLDQGQGEQRLVPKFASFKAKNNSVHEYLAKKPHHKSSSQRKVEQDGRHRRAGSDQDRRQYREISQRGHVHHKSSSQIIQGDNESISALPSQEAFLKAKSGDLFIVDREGDSKNLTFGTLHRSSVPAYKRSGFGDVIGSTCRIDHSRSDNKVTTLSTRSHSGHEKGQRHFLARGFPRHEITLRVKSQRHTSITDAQADFLPLRSPKAKKRKRRAEENCSDSQSSSDSVAQEHLLARRRNEYTNQPADVDPTSGPETSATEYGTEHSASEKSTFRQRTALSREVETNPTNCQAWLKLINLQDKVLWFDTAPGKRKTTKAEERSVAEIKISIYEKALRAVTKPADKERLIGRMMDEGSKVWDVKTISRNWEKYLRTYPRSLKLWRRYLNFRESNYSVFRYEDMRAEYAKCLGILRQPNSDGDAANLASRTSLNTYAYILLRSTLMMRETGFTECAVAIWQAVLEFQCFRTPKTYNEQGHSGDHADATLVKSFESFWESESPRIGEEGADGWAKFVMNPGEPSRPQTDLVFDTPRGPDGIAAWVSLEREYAAQAKLPGRTIDDVAENDPSRIILFSDVKDFLPNSISALQDQIHLVKAWLDFCQLPRIASVGRHEATAASYGDPFVRKELLFRPRNGIRSLEDYYDKTPADVNRTTTNGMPSNITQLDIPFADYQTSPSVLFAATDRWFSAFDAWFLSAGDNGAVSVGWIRRTLDALVALGIGGEDLAEYYLALELRLAPDKARKTARKLLKARPSSLRLYNVYACIEYRLHAPTKAQEVILSALKSSSNLEETHKRDEIFLWHTWVWELLSSQQAGQALKSLLSYPSANTYLNRDLQEHEASNNLSVTPAIMLRAQQALIAARDHFISLSLPLHSYLVSDLLILLSYLSSSRSLEAAQNAFSTNTTALSARFPPNSPSQELLHQSFARILHYHATNVPLFKPALTREALASSISLFPHNTIFLSLYAWNETRFRIDDRVRSIINDVVLTSKKTSPHDQTDEKEEEESITPHIFAVYNELGRSVTLGSNNNTIRNTFERAMDTTAGAHSAALWRLYVLFEIERGDREKGKA